MEQQFLKQQQLHHIRLFLLKGSYLSMAIHVSRNNLAATPSLAKMVRSLNGGLVLSGSINAHVSVFVYKREAML